ncbi:MAG: hypothetical protein J0J06_01775 [Sphingomonas sp.]|uniref:hypothetical protein n=1 Tax=Sphingomonas sp. TaxID=28214 RepID=UPI001ACF2604|nr:hypothetical protein [Sphingomonas sp.]MBN8814159.1 hypothetical protein [Sphingomonas sp.]
MAAQRKLVDQNLTASPEGIALVERAPMEDYRSPRALDGTLPTSPAIVLQEELAARISGGEAVLESGDVKKWPMPLRIATIVGLSLALWAGVVLGAVVIIT